MRPIALFVVVSLPAVALAHDTWLLPTRASVAVGEPVLLEMTSAMKFPEPEVPAKPERIVRSGLRLGGTTVALAPLEGGGKALKLSAPTKIDGLATIWAESLPREIDMKPAQVEHYLDEVGAPEVRDQWTKGGRGPWHEKYVKYTKSFIRVGAPREDRSWADPVGLAFEIVPAADPGQAAPGQPFTVRVLEDGKPAAKLSVAAVTVGGAVVSTQLTDAEGRATFLLGGSGPWMIRATRIQPGDTKGTWRSRFTTLTFHGAPR